MTKSSNLPNISKIETIQLPLKGFRVEVESGHPKRRKFIEGMGDGRFRVHVTQIRK